PSRARSPAARRARAAGAAAGMSGEPAAAVGRPGEEVALAGLLAPLGGQLTLGSTLGYCAGVALRFAGRIAAGGVGASFCLIQGLSYSGYIQVDWRKVERDYVKILDQNGDGKVDTDDLVLAWHRVRDCLAFNLPAGAGFTAGLAYGLGATFGTSWKAALVAGVGGKALLPRVAMGGLGALGSPAALVGLQGLWGAPGPACPGRLPPPPRPALCLPLFLGEPEERCRWAPRLMAPARE
ncbi:unnamed protein product, partial [Prorocentrum cordatum]